MNLYDTIALVGALVACLTFYFTFVYPRRKDREHFNSALLGRSASPGVPALPSVIEKLDAIGIHLEKQDKALDHILHEIPPNGVPFRSDVDAIKTQLIVVETNVSHLNDQLTSLAAERRRLERVWAAALAKQNIEVPTGDTL